MEFHPSMGLNVDGNEWKPTCQSPKSDTIRKVESPKLITSPKNVEEAMTAEEVYAQRQTLWKGVGKLENDDENLKKMLEWNGMMNIRERHSRCIEKALEREIEFYTQQKKQIKTWCHKEGQSKE